jgi:predicted nucleic acid-binding protein
MDAALYTSVISVGELTFGVHNAPYEYQERLWQRTREILARFQRDNILGRTITGLLLSL